MKLIYPDKFKLTDDQVTFALSDFSIRMIEKDVIDFIEACKATVKCSCRNTCYVNYKNGKQIRN